VQIGVPQHITREEIYRIAAGGNRDYDTYNLARSALIVLHRDIPEAPPFDELLDRDLNPGAFIRLQAGNAWN
jgi:hypothetical protein